MPLKRLNDRQVLLVLAAMTLAALLLALWTTRGVNPLRGDSGEYLFFDSSRTLGYPAFLALVRLVTGQVGLAVPAQMTLLAGSLLFFGWSFHRFAGRPAFSFAFQALLLSQVALWKASAFLMTEALSAALVAIWCGQLLRMVKAPSWEGAALLVGVSGLATMVRPSLVALFFGTAVFMFAAQPARARGWGWAIAGAGLIISWAATPIAQYFVHGSTQTTSPVARGVLQHTLYCRPSTIPTDAESAFVEQYAASVSRYTALAPSDIQASLQRAYSTPLRFGLIIPVLGRRHHLDTRSQVDPYLRRIAYDRVKANPFCYARSVAQAYYRTATFDTNRTSEDAHQIDEFMKVHPPVEVPQYPVLPGDEQMARRAANAAGGEVSGLNPERLRLGVAGKIPFAVLLPVRLLYGGAALAGILALAALPFRRRFGPDVQGIIAGAAAMGAAFHGTLAITALVELGLSRYVIPLWPMVCGVIAIALSGGLQVAFRSAQRRQARSLVPVLLDPATSR